MQKAMQIDFEEIDSYIKQEFRYETHEVSFDIKEPTPDYGSINDFIKESDDDKSILDCTIGFFKYLGNRCFGDLKDDSSYMRRTASTSRGEKPEVLSPEDQYIDNINDIVNSLEIDLKFQ